MTNLEKACDDLWRKIIKERDGYKCRCCGKPANSAHHIMKRSYGNTRYNLLNGITLCVKCHSHDFPGQLLANVRASISYEEYNRLYDLAQEVKIWRSEDLKDLKQALKEILCYYKTESKCSNP